ncbi:hypothetical protein AGLY_008481 [Aphis glycines]|uniref:Uncharacterized protein n=1 Tax=Aphis glycines TaxID=307491 RepID=A0A6G0TKB0_APHGL|nr:hypothetical protein AGLY_008481 [Aphis glycines]
MLNILSENKVSFTTANQGKYTLCGFLVAYYILKSEPYEKRHTDSYYVCTYALLIAAHNFFNIGLSTTIVVQPYWIKAKIDSCKFLVMLSNALHGSNLNSYYHIDNILNLQMCGRKKIYFIGRICCINTLLVVVSIERICTWRPPHRGICVLPGKISRTNFTNAGARMVQIRNGPYQGLPHQQEIRAVWFYEMYSEITAYSWKGGGNGGEGLVRFTLPCGLQTCRGDGVDAVFKDHPPKGRPGRTARGKSLRPQPLARVRAREKDPPRDAAATKAFSRMRRWCNQPSACTCTAPDRMLSITSITKSQSIQILFIYLKVYLKYYQMIENPPFQFQKSMIFFNYVKSYSMQGIVVLETKVKIIYTIIGTCEIADTGAIM